MYKACSPWATLGHLGDSQESNYRSSHKEHSTLPHANLAEAYSASLSASVLYCLEEGAVPVLGEEVWGVE